MDHQTFRKLGHEMIDWIADYMEKGHDGPVAPRVEPGEILAQLPAHPPAEAEDPDLFFKDFKDIILPGILHWNDPRFFGWFPCNHSAPGILGDLLSAGLNVNAMNWSTSPAATELEILVMRWLGEMIGLDWPGVIQDTASTATICAVVAARDRAADVKNQGFYQSAPLVAYTSEHANLSVMKAVWVAGIGEAYLRRIPADETYGMDAQALRRQVEEDVAAGLKPAVVISTLGTTSSTARDPIADINTICQAHQMWHHIDAAMVGTAAILPEFSWIMDGVNQADSFVFNPHKWMFTNFDCSALFVKEPEHLKRALSIQAAYVKTNHDDVAENFRDWSLQLGRRFRALKLWYVIRTYGVQGLQNKLRNHMQMAKWFADQVNGHPDLHLLEVPPFATVCFHTGNDERTNTLLAAIEKSGEAVVSPTRLSDKQIIRISFGQTHQTMQHAEALWQLITSLLKDV